MVQNKTNIWNSWAMCFLVDMSLKLVGPFYGNKIMQPLQDKNWPVENIIPWPYGIDVLIMDRGSAMSSVCWSMLVMRQKYPYTCIYLNEKLCIQFPAQMLTYYAPKGIRLRKATMAGYKYGDYWKSNWCQSSSLRLSINVLVCWLHVLMM